MKKLLIFTALLLFSMHIAVAQCNVFMPMVKGTVYQMAMFDSKEKPNGTVTYTVAEVRNDGSEADMVNEVVNAKGKPTSTTNYTIRCNNGQLEMDIKSFIPAQTMEGYKDMDVKAKGEAYLVIPNTLNVGDVLPDANGTWEVSSKGSATVMTTLTMSITNRKVAAAETVTTPAGTFDCFKITGDMKLSTSTFGVNVTFDFSSEDYYSPGTGLVKSASFRNGKMQGYNVLVKK